MSSNIILIGPSKCRRFVAKLLSDKLGLNYHSTNDFQDKDFEADGYDSAVGQMLWYEEGPYAYYQYLMPFRAQLIKRSLAKPDNLLFDIEMEFSVYEDFFLLEQMQKVFEPFDNVVLLTPALEPDLADKLVRQNLEKWYADWAEINDFFVDSESNYRIAKITHFTEGKTPEESSQELLSMFCWDEPDNIILIGPMTTGKSTLGSLLAKKLNRSQAVLDLLIDKYYPEIGYDEAISNRIRATQSPWDLYYYWQSFHPYGVEQVLKEYSHSVIDFGGGHSVYTDEALLFRVEKALNPYKNVALIIPSPDKAVSKQILRERTSKLYNEIINLQELLTKHPSNMALSKIPIYTEGKNPEQVCDEILGKIKL